MAASSPKLPATASPKPLAKVAVAPKSAALDWTIHGPDELFAELSPPKWMVEGLIPEGSLGMIVAFGEGYKTWLAYALVIAHATGDEWLGMSCGKGESFIVDFENGDYELRRRLHQLWRGANRDKGPQPPPPIHFISFPGLNMTHRDFFVKVEEFVRPKMLVVIDTATAASPGVDQDKPVFADALYRLAGIANRVGCVFLILHHSTKEGASQGGDDRTGTRGSGAIYGAEDWEFKMYRVEKSDKQIVHQTKSRKWPKHPESPWRISFQDSQLMVDGHTVKATWLETAKIVKPKPLEERFRDALVEKGAPMSQTEFKKRLNTVNNDYVKRWLVKFCEEKKVSTTGGEPGEEGTLYTLGPVWKAYAKSPEKEPAAKGRPSSTSPEDTGGGTGRGTRGDKPKTLGKKGGTPKPTARK